MFREIGVSIADKLSRPTSRIAALTWLELGSLSYARIASAPELFTVFSRPLHVDVSFFHLEPKEISFFECSCQNGKV